MESGALRLPVVLRESVTERFDTHTTCPAESDEPEFQGSAAIHPLSAQTAGSLAREGGGEVRRHGARHRVLIESGVGAAEGRHLPGAERLCGEPFDGVVPVAVVAMRFVAERVPLPFGGESASCVLYRDHVSMLRQ